MLSAAMKYDLPITTRADSANPAYLNELSEAYQRDHDPRLPRLLSKAQALVDAGATPSTRASAQEGAAAKDEDYGGRPMGQMA